MRQLTALSREQLVDKYLNAPVSGPNRPAILDSGAEDWEMFVGLQQWWVERMASTSPLAEKMALFWHGHFCSAYEKVASAPLMWQQIALFRSMGLGNFRSLTKYASVTAAMLRYLDNETNVAGAPQENFARELWELFMLGVGNYTQDEVVDSARAWTGHGLNQWPGKRDRYEFHADEHDNGPKTIFGVTKNWNGPEVIDWTLDHPDKGRVAARFIGAKLWSFFAYENPSPELVDQVATALLGSKWEIKPVLRFIFLHPEFWSDRSRNGRVRSPIEWLVNLTRHLGMPVKDAHPEWFCAEMGQELFNPPDVSGWKLNSYWISTSSYWAKSSFVQYVMWKVWDESSPLHHLKPDFSAHPDPIGGTFEHLGLPAELISGPTRHALTDWMNKQNAAEGRPEWTWTEWIPLNLFRMVALSPELQVA